MTVNITALAESLLGTCEPNTQEMEEFSIAQWNELELITMNCNTCGWWVEAHEISGDGESICNDCLEE